jgi:signal transduction histidine kinase
MNTVCLERVPQDDIEREVAQRTAELQETVHRLENFCCHLAHDLRDALGGIAGLADIAHEALDERHDSGSALRALPLISQQAHRSAQRLRGLLRLAKASRDAALQICRLDVRAMAEQVAQEVAVCHAPRAMPQVCAQPMPAVAADADLLYAVLYNLIGNAVKFTRERSDGRIDIDAVPEGGMLAVCVRDNGVGFDPARAAALFQPYSRLHGGRYEGCGLGLSIVRRAVERQGGQVWVTSAPGQGASFFFTLPLACS